MSIILNKLNKDKEYYNSKTTNEYSRIFNGKSGSDPPELVLLIGAPGSGKSTYINRWYPSYAFISQDDILEELDFDQTYKTALNESKQKLKEVKHRKQIVDITSEFNKNYNKTKNKMYETDIINDLIYYGINTKFNMVIESTGYSFESITPFPMKNGTAYKQKML